MTGIPDDFTGVGAVLDLMCKISRIKPEASQMYWMIGERRENGSLDLTINDDSTFYQFNILSHK